MINLLSISVLCRLTILVASGVVCFYPTTVSFAASATNRVSESRHALAECINTVFLKLAEINGLTPVGVAYFVGLGCGEKREAYASALRESNIPNSAEYIEKIDAIVVHAVLRRLGALKRLDDRQSLQVPAN